MPIFEYHCQECQTTFERVLAAVWHRHPLPAM